MTDKFMIEFFLGFLLAVIYRVGQVIWEDRNFNKEMLAGIKKKNNPLIGWHYG